MTRTHEASYKTSLVGRLLFLLRLTQWVPVSELCWPACAQHALPQMARDYLIGCPVPPYFSTKVKMKLKLYQEKDG